MTNGRIGGDRKSKQAIAARSNLVNEIGERRAQLDDHIRRLRHVHGNAAPPTKRANPRHYHTEKNSVNYRWGNGLYERPSN